MGGPTFFFFFVPVPERNPNLLLAATPLVNCGIRKQLSPIALPPRLFSFFSQFSKPPLYLRLTTWRCCQLASNMVHQLEVACAELKSLHETRAVYVKRSAIFFRTTVKAAAKSQLQELEKAKARAKNAAS